MTHRANRFDFLRLLFAIAVFLYHAVVLSSVWGTGYETALSHLAEISIQGFFIISGMLVYGSLERSKNITDYGAKRVRRLYPAYIVVILVPAVISLMLGGSPGQIGKYVAANLAFLNFLQPTLPGLFEGQRFVAVNGALWTLKIEVMFYMTLPVLGWVLAKVGQTKLGVVNWGVLLLIYASAEIWRAAIPHMDIPHAAQIARQLPGQMSFFVTGMALWMLRDRLRENMLVAATLGLVFLAASFMLHLEFLRAGGLGAVVFALAYAPGPKLNAARFGDLSYGVYITHFPIINALVAAGMFAHAQTHQMWQGMGLAVLLVFVASLLMWHLIEKPALRRTSHYRKAGRADKQTLQSGKGHEE